MRAPFFPNYREDLLIRMEYDFLAEMKVSMPDTIDFRRFVQLHDLLQADLIEKNNPNKAP